MSAPERLRRMIGALRATDAAYFAYLPIAALALLVMHRNAFLYPDWLPVHDTLFQYAEFLYALSGLQNGELPLWNSYLYGGQPFLLYMNHGLLLDPILWVWMIAGTALHLSPIQIYVCANLSGIVFFAIGGMLVLQKLTGDTIAAVAAAIILMFCGEACFWSIQVYSLAVVEYAPWVMWAALRYHRAPSVWRAVTFAALLGIAANRYYPVYLITFLLTCGLLLLAFYPRAFKALATRAFARDALIASLLLATMLLPTWLAYTEMRQDNYQISRYQGPEQREPSLERKTSAQDLVVAARNIVTATFSIKRFGSFNETLPFIGIAGLFAALLGMMARGRIGGYWSLLLLFTVLHYAGNNTPFYRIDAALMPFYRIMRTFGFYSGYVSLLLAVLAGLGIHRIRTAVARQVKDGMGWRLIASLLACCWLVSGDGGKNRSVSWAALAVIGLLIVIGYFDKRQPWRNGLASHAILITLLVVGIGNMAAVRGPLQNMRQEMFQYGSGFNFSFTRPPQYTVRQIKGFIDNRDQCCVTFYHMADKIDGPYWFGEWGSPHTLFVDKGYYEAANGIGFDRMMEQKLHFLRYYALSGGASDYGQLLDKSVLLLHDDASVRDTRRRVPLVDSLDLLPNAPSPQASAVLLRKSANDVAFSVSTAEALFLLYTDLYQTGFEAFIDGRATPVLKAMGVLKAVELSAGNHTVEFRFRPAYRYALYVYACMAMATLLGLIGCGVWRLARIEKASR